MPGDERRQVVVIDDRAGFYMVPSAAIAKTRTHLSGAQLAEALAGLACLAREAFLQHGANRDEPQTCEANLDELAGRILGVSRARALRILDNLVDAGALTKDAHRFDGTRRLPTKITFVDLAYTFAYVSGPAFRALRGQAEHGHSPFGALALYLSLVALGGDQRDQFPDGNRRVARASQPELAKLSGLSVSSVKRAVLALTAAGLVTEREQPHHALKTKTIYRLTDPSEHHSPAHNGAGADRSQADQRTAHSDTNAQSQPDRRTAHSPTNDSSQANPSSDLRATDGQLAGLTRAYVKLGQTTADEQNQKTPSLSDDRASARDGGGAPVREIEQLVDTFGAWTCQALGDRRASAVYDATTWRHAAQALLEQYDLPRLLAGIDRLRRDALLADKATTLPAFAKIAERAIARAAADQALAEQRATPADKSTIGGFAWASAHALISQAVSAFGPKGEQRALRFIGDRDEHVAAFVRHVGWRTVARSDEQMTDVKFAYLSYCKSDRPEAA